MSVFTEQEKLAWFPPERLTPSQWTEKHRVLPASVAAESGPLRLNRTPYLRGILDAFREPDVEEIVCLKSTQVGWSTALESIVGYCVDCDPGPILLVLDSEKTAKEVIEERIRPLIDNTSAVNQHISDYGHDNTLTGIKFDSCPLYMAWAGSPGTLARRAIRYALFDEVDKYPSNAGREADPISLGIERTQTYGYRRRILIGSTPTTRQGAIWQAWEAAGDKRRYYVPCPHCGEYQFLVFTQIKYPHLDIADKNLYADAIEQQGLAHYECASCHQPIKEESRTRAISRGVWLSEGQSIAPDGKIAGEKPRAKRIGFWINSLYSPWRSFSAIAAEHRRSLNDPGRTQNFRNSWLAEVWEEIVKTASVEDYRKLLDGAPKARIVPSWAEYLIAGADVQKDRMYWVVRAWGPEYRSQLIAHGLALTFDELKRHCLDTQFTLEKGGTSAAHRMFIDYGYRGDEILDFAKGNERIVPVKGDNDSQQMPVKYSTAGKHVGVPLWLLNTQLLKDKLSVLRNDGRWRLNAEVDNEYLQHLASEHKTYVKGKGERWETKTTNAANHWFDAEIYSLAGAEIMRVDLLTTGNNEPVIQLPPPESVRSPWIGNRGSWTGNRAWNGR